MVDAANADSFDVLGDAREYQQWLQLQNPPEAAPVEQKGPSALSMEDLPADIAQVVRLLDPEHAAVVLEAYQKLQEDRYVGSSAALSHGAPGQKPMYTGQTPQSLLNSSQQQHP